MKTDNRKTDSERKRAWRTPRITRLLTGGAASGPMVTTILYGVPMEGKATPSPTENNTFEGGPS